MSRIHLTILLSGLGLAGSFASGTLAQQPPAPRRPAAAEQLRGWVEELDAREFLTRETAMLRLIAAGRAAIPAVNEVFGGDSLEATSRALFILQQIGLSDDPATQEAARAALVAPTESKDNPALARRAAAALARLMDQRSAQALAELESLGAKVARAQAFDGVKIENIVHSLEIGPEFKGQASDLARLKWLVITRLVFAGENINSDWLAHVGRMQDLEELHLHSTAVTDDGLAVITRLQSLRQLGIYYTPIGQPALKHLVQMPGLSFVKLYGTKIDPAAAAEFEIKSGIPNVDFRKGAFLGVGCLRGETQCILSTVHANSPAERAGLAVDDVVVRFGDSKVTDFESLTVLISHCRAGDEIELEVQREVEAEGGGFRTKNVVTKVTLGPWGVDPAVENGWRP
jgi:hypothetical protein